MFVKANACLCLHVCVCMFAFEGDYIRSEGDCMFVFVQAGFVLRRSRELL